MKRGITLIALTLLTLGLTAFEASAQTQREYDTVRGWYERYLGREPDEGGWASWADQLARRPSNDVLADLLASPEYYQRHGNTPEGFVLGLYNEVLGRQPASDEVDNWVRRLVQH